MEGGCVTGIGSVSRRPGSLTPKGDLALTCDLYKMCANLADCVRVATPLLGGPTRYANFASFLGMPFDVRNIPIHLQEAIWVGHTPPPMEVGILLSCSLQ